VPHQKRVSAPAAKALSAYPKNLQRRIIDRINELGNNPRPADAETLSGNRDLLRVRVGGFRIVYVRQKPRLGDDRSNRQPRGRLP
jgi:mRNA-degrading endonuclease RelE of RelBE toxin-antitoxin system